MNDLTAAQPLLTDDERDAEFERLSTDDCGHIAAFVFSQYPAVADAALAAFARYQGGQQAATP